MLRRTLLRRKSTGLSKTQLPNAQYASSQVTRPLSVKSSSMHLLLKGVKLASGKSSASFALALHVEYQSAQRRRHVEKMAAKECITVYFTRKAHSHLLDSLLPLHLDHLHLHHGLYLIPQLALQLQSPLQSLTSRSEPTLRLKQKYSQPVADQKAALP